MVARTRASRKTGSTGSKKDTDIALAYEMSAFDRAIALCTSPAQVEAIQSMGREAFGDSAVDHAKGGDASATLISLCPRPEAVADVLSAVGAEVSSEVASEWN